LGKKDDDVFRSGTERNKDDQAINEIMNSLLQVEKDETHNDGAANINFQGLLKRGDVGYYLRQCTVLEESIAQMRKFSVHRHPHLETYYREEERKETLRERVDLLRYLLSNESFQLFPDYQQRKNVLQKLGYIESDTIMIKGRVACEINTCDELVATEMVFEGLLSNLTPEETAAVLSSLVFQDSRGDQDIDSELPPQIAECCEKMKRIAYSLGEIQKDCGLPVDPIEYCEKSLKFGLVHVVYEWALGIPFKDVVALTDVQEGSIVRCITRLDELCREIRNSARVVGNPTLYRKLEAASAAIKRDIVFASSLYVS
jgi:antiviral helicase SKI2